MDFEEELFYLYRDEAEESRQAFITEHGYTDVSEMTRSDRSFYELNRASTTKGALRRFHDRLNCGGYAFEIDTRLYPAKDNDYSKYISSILDNFSFIRLLGNSKLQDDEYLVFYRINKKNAHHFIKVNEDGLITEKNGYGNAKVFEDWPSIYSDSTQVVFAVKKEHKHHCSPTLDFTSGLDFNETVEQAISSSQNAFSYHSQNYRLKKTPSGSIVIVNDESKIIASVSVNPSDSSVEITTDRTDYIENLSGQIKPRIQNGRLLNLNEFRGKTKSHER